MGWEVKKLSDVCVIEKTQFREGDLPYIGMEDIEGHTGKFIGDLTPKTVASSTFRFSTDHILYGRLRPYLNKVLVPEFEGHCSSEIFPLKPSSLVSKKFLFYWFTSRPVVEAIDKTCTGARMPRANVKEVLTFDFPLPPLSEQKRIVAILDQTFVDIDKARANAEQNLKNARELFESYLQQMFSQSGDGWVETKLQGAVTSVSTGPFGSMLHKSDYVEGGIPLVNPINIVGDIIIPNNSKTVSAETVDRLKTYVLSSGDVVISRRGEIGRCAVVEKDQEGYICGTGCFYIKPSNILNPYYLTSLLRSSKYRKDLEKVATGATMKNLSNTSLKNVVITFPSNPKVQEKLLESIDDMSNKINRIEYIYYSKLKRLEELKKSILQKAFSGQLTADNTDSSNVIPFPITIPNISTTDLHAGILSIAYLQHEKEGKENQFGHVKAEKIAHMTEALLGINLGRNPIQDAAGPNDYQRFKKKVEPRAKKAGFFEFTGNEASGYRLIKKSQFNKLVEKTRAALAKQNTDVDNLIRLMVKMNTERAEIFATVYAAWNNLLLEKVEITDEAIVLAARENWHESKLNIPRKRFFIAIEWIRGQSLEPVGRGKYVK